MAIGGIAVFFMEYGGAVVLDRFIAHLTGENARNYEQEVNLKIIKGNTEETVQFLRYQIHEDYARGLQALRDAGMCETGSARYREYIKDALREFTKCATRKNAIGLPKARAYINKAICHQYLDENRQAKSALKDARGIALEVAKQENERYRQVPEATEVDVRLPDGQIVKKITRTITSVPEIEQGALAMIGDIDQALKALR